MYSIDPLPVEQAHLLTALLSSYRYKPYQAYAREYGQNAVQEFFIATVQERLRAAGTQALLAHDNGQVLGLVVWSTLKLESQCFGFPAARLDYLIAAGDDEAQRKIKTGLLKEVQKQSASESVRHLSIRVDAHDEVSIHSLEKQGFILVDGLITYGRNLRNGAWSSSKTSGFQIRSAAAQDLPGLRKLASSAFSFDRLHADPAIPKSAADAIHVAWLENSYSSGTDQVLIAVDEGGLLGYSVFKISHAVTPYFGEPLGLWVIAATAERARGMGVAKSLCLAMFDWHRDQGVRIVEGGTQLANVASARLHESCGFRVASTSLSFSKQIGAT